MPPTHAEPTCLGDNDHDNKAATRDSPGKAPDPGTKAKAGEVKAMAISVMAIAQEEEGATNSEADGDTKDEDEQETDNEEGEDDGEQDTDSDEGGDKDDNDNDDEQVPSNSATAKDPAKKAAKRAWYLKNREATKSNEVKEVQHLCALLAVKENKPAKLTESEESSLRVKYRMKVDHETWMTWPRCPLCGKRRPNKQRLLRHQKSEHVGNRYTQKRKEKMAEVKAWLEEDGRTELRTNDGEAEVESDDEAEVEKDEEAEVEKRRAVVGLDEAREVRLLCAALADKWNTAPKQNFNAEAKLLSAYNKRNPYKRTIYAAWMTWLRCPICGMRRPDEERLMTHQKRDHIGGRCSQRRKDRRAEVGMEVDDKAGVEEDAEAELEKEQ